MDFDDIQIEIDCNQAHFLKQLPTLEEVKETVWAYGTGKAPSMWVSTSGTLEKLGKIINMSCSNLFRFFASMVHCLEPPMSLG